MRGLLIALRLTAACATRSYGGSLSVGLPERLVVEPLCKGTESCSVDLLHTDLAVKKTQTGKVKCILKGLRGRAASDAPPPFPWLV